MDTEIFTERDILHNDPPIVFTKPWFAQGWVIGVFWASLVTGYAAYSYFVLGGVMRLWLILAGLLWVFTLYKYLKGVRFIEVSGEVVRVFARDVVTPIGEIPFERMTLVQDVDEIYFIRKARFTGGFSLKRAYWKNSFVHMNEVFKSNASYVMGNYLQKNQGGFNATVISRFNPVMQSRGGNGTGGILGALTILYEFVVGVLLWPFYQTKQGHKD